VMRPTDNDMPNDNNALIANDEILKYQKTWLITGLADSSGAQFTGTG